MPFVNEDIPQEAKEKWGLRDFPRWTIDHENDVAVLWRECTREHAAFGDLFWKGEKLSWGGGMYYRTKPEDIPLNSVDWTDVYVEVPDHLSSQKQDIVKALRDALYVCGSSHTEKNIKSVNVTVASNMQFEEGNKS